MGKKLKTDHISGNIKKEEYTIDILNPHCFADICKYLSIEERLNLKKVSKKCKESSKFAWHDMKKLNLGEASISSQPDQTIVRQALKLCGEYLTELSLGSKFDCQILTSVTKHCRNLVTLKLQLSGKFNENFNWKENTFATMTNLKSVELMNCKIGDSLALSSLPDGIEEIRIARYVNEPFEMNLDKYKQNELATNILRWKNLKSLTIERWEINDHLFKSIIQCEQLIHLSLLEAEFIFIFDDEKLPLVINLHNLEHLNLESVFFWSPGTLTEILKNCKKLTYLNLKKATYILHPALLEIGNLKNLEYLNLAKVSDVGDAIIDNIVMNCMKLKHLDITNCYEITEEALKKLIRMNLRLIL